jgi:hypothetical protein
LALALLAEMQDCDGMTDTKFKLHNHHKCGERGLYIDGKFVFSSKASADSLFQFAIANGASIDSIRVEFRSAA